MKIQQRDLTGAQQRFLDIIGQCTLPLMAAPMFLVSGPELVVACAKAGIIGSFPAPNARNVDMLDAWLTQVSEGLAGHPQAAPWALNMVVHSTYDRFDAEMALVLKHQPKIVSTALGSPKRVLEHVHGYGGIVVADVVTPKLARKAAEAGADVLILVTSGAGGHTGYYHPFAFLSEVRKFWNGPIGLAGAITTGAEIRAAQMLGADFVVAGTRFIPVQESRAQDEYRELVVQSGLDDLVLTKAVSGVLANWLKPTLEAAGYSDAHLKEEKKIDFSGDISAGKKAWKDVWSAGHGLGAIGRVATVPEVVGELCDAYHACVLDEQAYLAARLGSLATEG